MSNWTHVAGIIRVDCIRFNELNKEEEMKKFDKLIGKELHYKYSYEEWEYANNHPEEYLPLGSEGFYKGDDCMMLIYNDGYVLFLGSGASGFLFEELQAICETAKQIKEGDNNEFEKKI